MAYIPVLGLEAAIAVILSSLVLHEKFSVSRAIAIVIILTGLVMPRRT
jgi:uncharacterized membrane protein